MQDRVCIAVPVYNANKTLAETLDSLVNQDYKNFEIFICDNNSNDGTSTIIANYEEKYPELIRHIVNPIILDGEANWTFLLNNLPDNFRFLALFHADDVYNKSIISKQVERLQVTGAGAAFAVANLIDENGININTKMKYAPTLPKDLVEKDAYAFEDIYISILKNHNFIKTPSVLFDKNALDNLDVMFKKEFKSSADLDLWFRIAKNNKVVIIDEPLINYRISSSQGTKIINKGRTKLADFFSVMDAHLSNEFKDNKNVKWYEARRAMDLILCAYHLVRINEINEANKNLKIALKIKNIFYMCKINAGIKHFSFGILLYMVLQLGLKNIFNRYFVFLQN